MLFISLYKIKSSQTEAEEKRTFEVFAKWQPPQGLNVLNWWFRADGTGVVVFEADSAEVIAESLSPWYHIVDFNVQPAVDVAKSAELTNKAIAWRESVR